ncbi:MAG: DUF3078 domain-containing protein [Paludibacteraceae bacterium]|nr:DUF3078 domain-containing protein [Paludibacteraceae bacterium]
MFCAVTNLAAQNDSIPTDSVSAPADSIHLYADTFRLGDQQQAIDEDEILLRLVAQQSVRLHANDTTDTLTAAEYMRLDSLRRELVEIDSLRAANAEMVAQTITQIPTIAVERSWIKDAEEDRNDVLRAMRDMHTHWRKEATVMLQVTQTFVTKNWYQGGSSSFAGLGILKGQIGYHTERFTWENTGEWRMGGSTVSADSVHKVNTTDDMFRLYSKANLKIVPKLFGSFSAEFETRFLPTYKSNSKALKSGPFSPVRFNIGVGLDYKPIKDLSISFSPLSYKVVHITDTARVTVTDYGLKAGQQTQHNLGSSVRIEYKWKPVREVVLDSKFYMYTNYRDVELDLEINCDFIINRFMSARLMLHPRFDSSVIMEGDDHAKMQFRELLSIGFAHKFR